jgi:16S rRNA (uracil1498-N3)-methyltransferase
MIHIFATSISPQVVLQSDDAFHLFSVLRLKAHERFQLVYQGQAYLAEVANLEDRKISIIQPLSLKTEPPFPRNLYLPLLKGEKLEWIIQKAVELGVTTIQLFSSRFTVVDWRDDQWPKKNARLQKIIHDAAMQSQRLFIPLLFAPKPLSSIMSSNMIGMKLIAMETERLRGLKLSEQVKQSQAVHLIVGPEGGFDNTEIEEANHYEWSSFSLGTRILRSETSVIASLAILEELMTQTK